MNYRVNLESSALRQMGGLPLDAIGALARVMARICEDPHSPVYSSPSPAADVRVADLGESGFAEYIVDEDALMIRVVTVVWSG